MWLPEIIYLTSAGLQVGKQLLDTVCVVDCRGFYPLVEWWPIQICSSLVAMGHDHTLLDLLQYLQSG
jgi:hypothetical protein